MKLNLKQAYFTLRFMRLKKMVQNLYEAKRFKKIIDILNSDRLEPLTGKQASELFLRRGNAYEGLKKYDKAILDYTISLKHDPDNTLAFFNRGTVKVTKREYESALEDFKMAISKDKKFVSAYIGMASILRWKGQFREAVEKLSTAISADTDDANAYYNRGTARMVGHIDWHDAISDFKKFLELAPNDTWQEYANYYIKYMTDRVNNKKLYMINRYVTKIKNFLRTNERILVTHYTTLSALKKLVYDESKFRLSEGNFLNDPSEGRELFNFLDPTHQMFSVNKDLTYLIDLKDLTKPFIGSFVVYSEKDDLNMWRLYGKEEGVEANGCSITIDKEKFLNDLIDSINIDDEGYNSLKDDIGFFYIAYYDKENDNFLIPNNMKCKEFNRVLKILKTLIKLNYKKFTKEEKKIMEEDLVSIAFLFKNMVYKNEQEVRILTNGDPFKKKIDSNSMPPKVYIELIQIKNYVEQIKFGPKTGNFIEWAASLNYAYDGQPPHLEKSELPYK